ncbi:MAG: bifunctional aspartate kinase/homoserine dehydrogenase I [Candidatus Eisenbacteria bacterium]|uniref:Bifunctional aspartate kinase/homoserine dehydrogenase I n=1 Tax=Eiseniibacteriota bacterium TaxID=2212470 RepID=A0A7Y2H1T5_UNCEI|nr:bifunctional aspartate kinase/homoserine dehydrogenase I [Candidatus Eisenbacteria bacterium]
MRVLKFGGSSLGNVERIQAATKIMLATLKHERTVVVVSAFGGVTDQLIEAARRAENGDTSYEQLESELVLRHETAVHELLGKKISKKDRALIDGLLEELHDILHGIYLLRDCSRHSLDLVSSLGERLSATILASYLKTKATAVDARDMIIATDHTDPAAVAFEETNTRIKKTLRAFAKDHLAIVTGFIASTPEGRTVTLGRDGSDYTAAILGAALKASVIEIWTDVDGVLSADPRAVRNAFVLPDLSYEEAMEMSYFGASVIHSAALAPAIAHRIPIQIKNTLNPKAPGTRISRKASTSNAIVKGISSVDGVSLFTLRGPGMVGVPGTAERLFRNLARASVNVILISQASSEHTICFAVNSRDEAVAARALQAEFQLEMRQKMLFLDVADSQTVVAVVGEGMKGKPGVSGQVFQSLGQHHVNIAAIAQGGSERNISFVLHTSDKRRALEVIHQAFFETKLTLNLFVLGVGNVGRALLEQLRKQQENLLEKGIDLRVCGVSNSRKFIFDEDGIDLREWQPLLKRSRNTLDLKNLTSQIRNATFTNFALVDCTASAAVVKAYPDFVKADMHIVTPNKLANVLPWGQYQSLLQLLDEYQKYFLFEANVGAGMPVISTVSDLIASGDTIHKIEGVFSGTLSYLFNNFDGVQPFSELVQEAHQKGFTEPDPREDLSGQDVGRKLLIFARILGNELNLSDVKVENLVPSPLRRGDFAPDFYAKFAKQDKAMQKRIEEARSKAFVLRYVGTLTPDGAEAGLKEFPVTHPFAGTRGTDNIMAFTTERYSNTPLVLQGPGAGADVTAMGVFSDILKLANYLPY